MRILYYIGTYIINCLSLRAHGATGGPKLEKSKVPQTPKPSLQNRSGTCVRGGTMSPPVHYNRAPSTS